MLEFKRPNITYEEIDAQRGRFTVEPLERGFGYTLGNSLRRILLSSLLGMAVTSIKIEGIEHEFTSIKGVREDVTDIILNIKSLVLKGNGTESAVLRLSASGPKKVTAADIEYPAGVEIVNKDLVIANLNKDGRLEMTLNAEKGRGYTAAEWNKKATDVIGVIPIDSIFTPIKKVSYTVEHTRVGQRTDYDKLIMEITTNGALTPKEALNQAAQIMIDHMSLFVSVEETKEKASVFVADEGQKDIALNRPIEELELSVRSFNCLKRQGINTLQDLLNCSEIDLANIRNFGTKSIEEVKEKLSELGYSLKGRS
jgi:DNA-directed RNA polymerase subunit alpha